MIFVAKYISAMVFGGGILGGVHKIWGDLYLNSTIVLFDTYIRKLCIYSTTQMQCHTSVHSSN